jgi:aldehyde dehydrogenase (NAD+)
MIADFPATTETALRSIFDEMRRRYREAPTPPLAERRANLDKLEAAICKYRKQIVAALHADFAKSAYEAEFTEIVVTLGELRSARAHLQKWMKPEPVLGSLSMFGSSAEVRFDPKGVVAILAPWNYPFQLTMAPLIAALAAGNRCIVRPSEKARHTRDLIVTMLREAFPATDVAVVGGEIETAEALLKLPFDHIFFTGSTRVGKLVMRAAAEHLASVTLELGGKSPCVVTAAADIGWAAKRIAWGKFMNAGQTCIAPDYVLVHESRERELLDALVRSVVSMYGATEAERAATPDFCRIIDDGHFGRVAGLLHDTVRAGATVEIGGVTDAARRYVAPTVLSAVTFDAPVMGEEIFGPVLPVISYSSLADAIAKINALPKPLALYAFSKRAAEIERILLQTPAGATVVNDTVLHWAHPHLPAGGVGQSGIGNYHGRYGFKAFSHERAVLRQSKASLAPLLTPPYGKKTTAMLRIVEKLPS